MHITRVGFGAWAIGGAGWSFAWGSQEDAESVAAGAIGRTGAGSGPMRPPATQGGSNLRPRP
jgi:hypothetical protein